MRFLSAFFHPKYRVWCCTDFDQHHEQSFYRKTRAEACARGLSAAAECHKGFAPSYAVSRLAEPAFLVRYHQGKAIS